MMRPVRFLPILSCAVLSSLALAHPARSVEEAATPSAGTAPSKATAVPPALRELNTGFIQLFEGMAPSVVVIEIQKGQTAGGG